MKILGIDLGTTNSALAVADGDGPARAVPISQVVGPGEVAERPTLPSFLLLPGEQEVPPAQLQLPWSGPLRYAVGTFARERGAELPHRLVSSAKSWLCNPAIERTAQVLPFRGAQRELGPRAGGAASAASGPGNDAEADGERVSPVNASARYLAHLRAAWDDANPDDPADEQEVLVTVPASFDPVARELTVVAAREAGFDRVTLLEEPQAAFYAYLAARGDGWRKDLAPGDVVLVCDIGGGTTDFSLIEVADDGGNLGLERIAVGDHILLGGDNMDLALAALAGKQLADAGKQLDAMQQRALVHACRRAKETLLGGSPPESVPISILGRGSKLIGGTLKVEVTRAQAEAFLVDGFFPVVPAGARAERRRAAGLREMGLPYAHDPAITRHLAEFLGRFGRMPTAVLFNGGVMKAERLQGRVIELLRTWCGRDVRVLAGGDLDLSVALGAAHYGEVRRGKGVRIRGGTARAYYIGIESAMPAIPGFAPPVKALCVAPQGLEEGSAVELPDDELGLVVGENVTFRFFAAATRKDDRAGALIDADTEGLVELDPVEKLVPAEGDRRAGDLVPVRLEAHVTEVGTLELWCAARDGSGRWKLEYSVRERDA
ncbi:MAG TPA: Hsp70 family protein [Kofleriaceae bacterium]|nr:Hsp70 family protein [Kofleriaceae bacterium]